VLTSDEVRRLAHKGEKDGKVSFWLQPREYEAEEFRENWERIGSGLSESASADETDVQRRCS